VFALNVTGTSMWPKFEDRALVYVSSAKRPLIGDYVVVELHPLSEGADVPGFIKRLVKQTATKLICEQFNPKKKVEFDLKRVKAIYRVIPLEELLGI
jgi:phage repressor protein C with HTH and peptisase S24 domain